MDIIFNGYGYMVYLAGVAGLLHACLQMPSATLLHMTSHALGRNRRAAAFGYSLAFSVGVFLTVGLLLVIVSQLASSLGEHSRYMLAGVLTTAAGLFVMLRYFRETAGAQLWLPRKYVRWLHKQIEYVTNGFGAFGMGMLSILIELGLSLPLLFSAAVLVVDTNGTTVLNSFLVYASVVVLPLLLTGLMLLAGKSPLGLQRWRAEGKRFWQFFIGLGFILFGIYIASEQFTNLTGVM